MGCGGSKMGAPIDPQVHACVEMFQRKPQIQIYKNDLHSLKNIEDAYSSAIFGGSAFLPIGSRNKQGSLRDKKNPLEEEIMKSQVNYLYGGGFFTLKWVKVSKEEDERSPEGALY